MSVKRWFDELQPSLLAGPYCGSTSLKPPAGAEHKDTGKAPVQATPSSDTSKVYAPVWAPVLNGAIQM